MPSYTLPELIAMMEPQHQRDQALIQKCIHGLTVYAAMSEQADPGSQKVPEIRSLIENLACYWGLINDDPTILQSKFLQPFDERIEAAASGAEITDDISSHCAPTIYGLYRYGEDMIGSMGDDAGSDILSVSALMKEIAAAWDFESHTLDDLTSTLEAEVGQMDKTAPEHGMEMQ